jgi:hypothetical protein
MPPRFWRERQVAGARPRTMERGSARFSNLARTPRLAPDVSVRDRRELADQGRCHEHESEGDLVEASEFTAAGGEQEHDERGEGQDEGEKIHVMPPGQPQTSGR